MRVALGLSGLGLMLLALIAAALCVLIVTTWVAFAWWIQDLVAFSQHRELFDPDREDDDVRTHGHQAER